MGKEKEREREILEKAKPFCTYTYLNKHKMVAHTYYQLGNNVKNIQIIPNVANNSNL